MKTEKAVIVLGTFDSKAEEHLFLKRGIERRGTPVLTINVGAKNPPGFTPDFDLRPLEPLDRDQAVARLIERGRVLLRELHAQGRVAGVVSAGGGTGTHLGTGIMKALPLGVPKLMVSTVAARDMAPVVGVHDITIMHSVGDLLGVNAITGVILDQAAAAIAAMAGAAWASPGGRKRVALTMFGFITKAAEQVRAELEKMGCEVAAFHANGTGGLAMEKLAGEGWFDGILDLATHELADSLYPGGYCRLIGPGRLEGGGNDRAVPRLVVPGGLDCAVLEFTRDNVPSELKDRRTFFYDFRSAVNLTPAETRGLAEDIRRSLNRYRGAVRVLSPMGGWSEAAGENGPLYDPEAAREFINILRRGLAPAVEVRESSRHINDPGFAVEAAGLMNEMMNAPQV
ncbi:MAG: Tm-1-like ATP-binding domain-containing protein [Pseudomonadota bacterium]